LFQPDYLNRTTAYRNLARQFDVVLEMADLKTGVRGINRSLYSLRHTSLLFAAKRNTQLSRDVLASNARTSTLMLDRHYLSKLENDDLADALHARDKKNKHR
jgi:thymidylate kinase